MRKVIIPIFALIMILSIVSCGKQRTEQPLTTAPFKATLAEAKAAAADGNKAIVLDFYTDWCTWCKRLDTVVMVDTSVIGFFKNEMVLLKVNAEQDTALAKQYFVSGYPTVVLTDKNGEEIDRIVGYLDAAEFLKTLRDYKNGIGTLDDLLKRADSSTDRTLFFEIADKCKYRGKYDEATTWFQRVIGAGEPTDSLSGESRLSLADMLRRAKNYDGALAAYDTIRNDFKGTIFAEGAEIWKAIVYGKKGDTTAAIAAFEGFVKNYPESEDVEYANEQIKKLKGVTEPQPPDTTK